MISRRKILVVDDNSANLTTCKAILKDTYDVFTALSAESMFSLLKNITPDLIMLDVKMPVISGYEAARILKKDENYKDIPIIFVSALSDVESEMEGFELGAVDYISKPYFPPILIKRIETHLDLIDKSKRLEKASQAKTDFLASMSHEMRTPLTAILGVTEIMLNTLRFDEETFSNLIKISRAGETLLNLINDILDISKIEAGSFSLKPVGYDVSAMLSDVISQSVHYIDSKPIEFVLDIDENLPSFLYGDGLRVKQVISNLLSNAFKYTHNGTVGLKVRCETEEESDTEWLAVQVRDTGIGIHPEDLDKIFTTYFRIEDEPAGWDMNLKTEGTGLGLYISRQITEMMGGTITVESRYGEGSCFSVRLCQKHIGDAVIGKKAVENLRNLRFYDEELEYTDRTRINMSYARVLIADDNPTNLDVAKNLISLYGITVDCVSNGRQAIEAISNENVKYDAIFMDYLMPGMDGIEAVRIIRKELRTNYAKTVPIIALTANAVTGSEDMFLQSGFSAYIPKPIDPKRLDLVLKELVRNEAAEAMLPDKTITINRKALANRINHLDIPGLDTTRGESWYGSGEDGYIGILRSYAETAKLLLDNLRDVKKENLKDYAIIVHGLKGSSRGIFADALGNEAEALELAAKSGDYGFVNANNQKFIDNIIALTKDIETACAKAGLESKPVKDKPDETLLTRFLDACINLDIDGMDGAMAEISKWDYTSDNGLAKFLAESLQQGNYKAIKERLGVIE